MAQDKVKIPKTVAGVPVPKRLRKGGTLASILNHPLGRTILADVLLAAAGAAATALNRHQTGGPQKLHSGEAAPDARDQAPSVTSDLAKSAAGALGNLALDVVEQVLPRKEAKKVKTKAKKVRAKAKGKNGDRAARRKNQEQTPRHH